MRPNEPGLPDLSSDYPIAGGQVAAYRRDGHLLLRGLASREEIAAYRPVIEQVVESVVRRRDTQSRLDDYSSLFTQVTNAWRLSEGARQLVWSRRFARVAALLMGVPGVRLYHDQALFKEPGGRPTPWHRDHYYWPLDTEHTITLWLPLADVSLEMGPMTFASGSHRATDLAELPISERTDELLARYVEENQLPLACTSVGAGDATFHSGRTLHSARPNLTSERREVMTVIYFADDTRLMEPDNPHRRVDAEAFVPGIRPGEWAASALNPVLYQS